MKYHEKDLEQSFDPPLLNQQNVESNFKKKIQSSAQGLGLSEEDQSHRQTLDQFNQIPIEDLSGDQGVQSTSFLQTTLNSHSNDDKKSKQKANMLYTVLTVMNCTIGMGVLATPYTTYVLGWLFFLISFFLITLVNQYSIIILLKVKNLSKHSNYSTIAAHVFKGKWFCIAVSSLICIGNLGFCVALFSILKGTGRKILEDFIQDERVLSNFYAQEWFMVIIFGIVLLPTAIVRRIQTLRYTASAGVIGICLSLIAYGIIFFTQMSQRGWKNEYQMRAFPQDGLMTLAVIPNIGLALVYQTNFYSIYKGLKNPTDRRTNIATTIGSVSSSIIYCLIGVMGYCLFGVQEIPNFLISIKYQQIHILLYLMIYIGFSVSVAFSVPVNSMVVRNNILAIMKLLSQQQNRKQVFHTRYEDPIKQIRSFMSTNISNKKQVQKKANKIFYAISLIIHILSILITILVESLQSVFNFVGSISSTLIGYIIPFLFYYLLIKQNQKKKTVNFYSSIIMMVIFIPFGIIAVISLYI